VSKYTQTDRPLKITTPLGPDILLLRGFHGREEISQLFGFHADMVADLQDEVRFDPIIGQSMTVEMRLLDVVRGRFAPVGKLPLTIPADQAAVDKNAPDVPGFAEAFDYAYKNRVSDKYVFGFGLTYGQNGAHQPPSLRLP